MENGKRCKLCPDGAWGNAYMTCMCKLVDRDNLETDRYMKCFAQGNYSNTPLIMSAGREPGTAWWVHCNIAEDIGE